MIVIKEFLLVEYTKMIEKMLDGIEVRLNCDYFKNKKELDNIANKIIYTGPIDEYYNYSLGNWNIVQFVLKQKF